MISDEVIQYNKKRFENEWAVLEYEISAGNKLSIEKLPEHTYMIARSTRLVNDLISTACSDAESKLQGFVSTIAQCIINLAKTALRLENSDAYGVKVRNELEWLYENRMIAHISIAFAHWFLSRSVNADYWQVATEAILQYYNITSDHEEAIVEAIPYAFMTQRHPFIRSIIHDSSFVAKRKNIQARRLSIRYTEILAICCLIEIGEIQICTDGRIQKAIGALFDKARDWRYCNNNWMDEKERMIVGFICAKYNNESMDPLEIAQRIRGF